MQKEVEDHERRRPGEDFSGFRKFFSEKRDREVGSEKREGERDRNRRGGEIFRKELPYRRDLSFVIASGESRNDRKQESDERSDEKEGDSYKAEVVRVVSGIFRSEDEDDELHVDLTQKHPDVSGKENEEGVLEYFGELLPRKFARDPREIGDVDGRIGDFQVPSYGDDQREYPRPRVVGYGSFIQEPESGYEREGKRRADEGYRILPFGFLEAREDRRSDLKEIA